MSGKFHPTLKLYDLKSGQRQLGLRKKMGEMKLIEINMLIFIKCQKHDDTLSCTVALQSLFCVSGDALRRQQKWQSSWCGYQTLSGSPGPVPKVLPCYTRVCHGSSSYLYPYFRTYTFSFYVHLEAQSETIIT